MASSRSNGTGDYDLLNQLKQRGITIVYENRGGEKSSEIFDDELEKAMQAGQHVIIVEPRELGEMTATWIIFGNFLHKLAVTTGMGAIATSYYWPTKPSIYCCLGSFSFLCTALYGFAWQFDPCTKYKLERSMRKRVTLPLHLVSNRCPIVLSKQNRFFNNFFRITVSFSAAGFCLWNLYSLYKRNL